MRVLGLSLRAKNSDDGRNLCARHLCLRRSRTFRHPHKAAQLTVADNPKASSPTATANGMGSWQWPHFTLGRPGNDDLAKLQ